MIEQEKGKAEMENYACFRNSLFEYSMCLFLSSSRKASSIPGVFDDGSILLRSSCNLVQPCGNSQKSCRMCGDSKMTCSPVSDTSRQHRSHIFLFQLITGFYIEAA